MRAMSQSHGITVRQGRGAGRLEQSNCLPTPEEESKERNIQHQKNRSDEAHNEFRQRRSSRGRSRSSRSRNTIVTAQPSEVAVARENYQQRHQQIASDQEEECDDLKTPEDATTVRRSGSRARKECTMTLDEQTKDAPVPNTISARAMNKINGFRSNSSLGLYLNDKRRRSSSRPAILKAAASLSRTLSLPTIGSRQFPRRRAPEHIPRESTTNRHPYALTKSQGIIKKTILDSALENLINDEVENTCSNAQCSLLDDTDEDPHTANSADDDDDVRDTMDSEYSQSSSSSSSSLSSSSSSSPSSSSSSGSEEEDDDTITLPSTIGFLTATARSMSFRRFRSGQKVMSRSKSLKSDTRSMSLPASLSRHVWSKQISKRGTPMPEGDVVLEEDNQNSHHYDADEETIPRARIAFVSNHVVELSMDDSSNKKSPSRKFESFEQRHSMDLCREGSNWTLTGNDKNQIHPKARFRSAPVERIRLGLFERDNDVSYSNNEFEMTSSFEDEIETPFSHMMGPNLETIVEGVVPDLSVSVSGKDHTKGSIDGGYRRHRCKSTVSSISSNSSISISSLSSNSANTLGEDDRTKCSYGIDIIGRIDAICTANRQQSDLNSVREEIWQQRHLGGMGCTLPAMKNDMTISDWGGCIKKSEDDFDCESIRDTSMSSFVSSNSSLQF